MKLCVLILPLMLLASPVSAAINCPDLFERDGEEGRAYVLAYVGGASPVPADQRQRNGVRAHLEARASARMRDYLERLADPVGAAPKFEVQLVTCDFAMDIARFTPQDAEALWKRNVIGLLWSSDESGRPSVVHLSMPYMDRRKSGTRQAEFAWAHSLGKPLQVKDWYYELDREPVAHQALLAMGIGFVSLKTADLQLAMMSFCQARSSLRLMSASPELVRPSTQALQQRLGQLMTEAVTDLAPRLHLGGTHQSRAALKLACSEVAP